VHELGLYTPYIHRNCVCNESIALHNRVLSPTVEPDEMFVRQLGVLARRIGSAAVGHTKRLSWASFVAGYKGPKLRRYTNALKKLVATGMIDRYSQTEMFVKPDSADPIVKGSYDPRAIQGRHPAYNIALGAFLKPFEEWFLEIDDWEELLGPAPGGYWHWTMPRGRLVAKGLSMPARGRLIHEKWSRLNNPIAFDCDASRFDMHVSLVMLMMEHLVYNTAYSHNPELKALLKKQLHNHGRTFGGLKYRTNGKRMSGDINTGLGNTIIMLFIFIFFTSYLNTFYLEDGGGWFNGEFLSWNGKWDFICDGDDSVFFTERCNQEIFAHAFPSFAQRLGFKMTVGEPVDEIELVNFCQSNPVLVDGQYVLVRNPRKALSGALCSKRPLRNAKEVSNHCWAVGKCELSLGQGIPIMQEFARACIRSGTPTKSFDSVRFELSYRYWHLQHDVKPKPVSAATRVSYERAFGITVAQQLHLEGVLSRWRIKCETNMPMFEPIDTGSGSILMDEREAAYRF